MGKKTILHLGEGVVLDKEQVLKLQAIIGNELQIEQAPKIVDLYKSYTERVDSLYHAVLSIVKIFPPKKMETNLEVHLVNHKNLHSFPKMGHLNEYKTILSRYIFSLMDILMSCWDWDCDSKSIWEKAMSRLELADEYRTMAISRPDLATLSDGSIYQADDYILQWDRVLPSCSKETLAELQAIKDGDFSGAPEWFFLLSPDEQCILKYYLAGCKDVDELVFFIPSRLRTLPGLANLCLRVLLILSNDMVVQAELGPEIRHGHVVSRDLIHFPEKIGDLYTERNLRKVLGFVDEFAVRGVIGHASKKALLAQTLVSPLPIDLVDSSILPDNALDQGKQRVVEQLRQETDIVICSTNHPLNKAKYINYTASNNLECNQLLKFAKAKLEAVSIKAEIAALQLSPEHSKTLEELTLLAIEFVKNNKSLDSYALFTEIKDTALKEQLIPQLVNDEPMESVVGRLFVEAENIKQKMQSGCLDSSQFVDMNEKKRRLIELFYSHYDSLQSWQKWKPLFAGFLLLNKIEKEHLNIINAFLQQFTDLAYLTKEYEGLLNSGFGTATIFDYAGRELCLSTLELLIFFYANNWASITCVSGKDRTAVALSHMETFWLYRQKYGYWPSFNDTNIKRKNMIALFEKAYLSGHDIINAAFNAIGCAGTKNLKEYLPSDIATEINNRMADVSHQYGNVDLLKILDTLAGNNEVRYIAGKSSSNELLAPYLIAANRLSEKDRKQLLSVITVILEEKHFWHEKGAKACGFFASPPAGVKKLRKVLKNSNTLQSSANLLAEIYQRVDNRPEKSSNRAPETQEFYDSLLKLYKHSMPDTIIKEELLKLESLKQSSFTSNIHA